MKVMAHGALRPGFGVKDSPSDMGIQFVCYCAH
jgi:hypothetical protein